MSIFVFVSLQKKKKKKYTYVFRYTFSNVNYAIQVVPDCTQFSVELIWNLK